MAVQVATEQAKEVAKGAFWSLAGNMVLKFVSFFYLVFLTHIALQDDIGTFYLALGLLTLVSLSLEIIYSSFSRYIPFFRARGEGERIKKLLISGISISVLLALLASVAVYFFADLVADFYSNIALGPVLKLLSVYVFLSVFFNVSTIILRSLKRIRDQVLISNVQNFSKLVLLAVFSYFLGADLFVITISFVLSYAIAILFSLVFLRSALRKLFSSTPGEDISYPALLREIVPFGVMITLASSLWTVISSLDKAMLGYFTSTSDVAVYTVATSLSILLLLFPSAVTSIFFPLVSQLYGEEKHEEIKNICETSMRWLLFVTVPFAMVFIVFSPVLLLMFYGSDYQIGATAMSIFSLGLLIRSLSYMPSSILASMRLVKIELKVAVIVTMLNFVLNLLLIPQFGMNGAAFASMASFLLATALILHYSKRFFAFRLSKGLLKLVAAGAMSFVVIYLLNPYIILAVDLVPEFAAEGILLYAGKIVKLGVLAFFFSICVAIYGAIALFLKSFRQEDLDIMQAALRKLRVIPESLIQFSARVISFGMEK